MTTVIRNGFQIWQDLKPAGDIPRLAIHEAGSAKLPGKDGGPYDAYRHVLWTAEMTRRYGESVARAIAETHEIEGRLKGQSLQSEAMDRRNNEVGFEIAHRLHDHGEDHLLVKPRIAL